MAFHRFFKWALERKALQVYGDGEQTRDFTYVTDVVDALITVAESSLNQEILNIGSGHSYSVAYERGHA